MAPTSTHRGANSQATGFAAGRGLLIVLFAAAIGVLLLAKAVDPNGDRPATEAAGSGSVPAKTEDGGKDAPPITSGATVTTPPATIAPKKEPQNVVVLVANGSGVAGAAKANSDALSVLNYNVAPATDYPSVEAATKVYFTPDYQADAIAVAQALGIDVAAVAAVPAQAFPLDTKSAGVIVVLGTDGQGLSPR